MVKIMMEQILPNLELPEVETPKYQQLLKQFLLSSVSPEGEKTRWKHLLDFISPLRKRPLFGFGGRWLSAGILVLSSLVLLAGLTIHKYKNPALVPEAQAKEVINQVYSNILSLPEIERLKIEENIRADLEASVGEARQAKDLKIFPETKIIRIDGSVENQGIYYWLIKDEPTEKLTVPRDVMVLSYTDSLGQSIVLGVDHNFLPLFKLIRLQNSYGFGDQNYQPEEDPLPPTATPSPSEEEAEEDNEPTSEPKQEEADNDTDENDDEEEPDDYELKIQDNDQHGSDNDQNESEKKEVKENDLELSESD